ncbi:hypothetical protein AURANDRAFT_62746 [Aureococcus anophagefferens]|jgi:hypothetical protein|uniref:Uncharacterized protein n=1 Tax=Aureococcus anophagefferens TaxID=44056 RepID=F0Y2W8_AURAN|nr:hypothetical protein AURANDRAFT_62746 [Aureococcus anophagefferens]EGB10350.1 hypothetical protein AURANDRAFT_62746 [Aureococcus anophagefferens]|eukprot:XP_009035155.1 hypothetical protein AURANDRAFT_62746 [Aureococcus anophagefferens]
MPPKTRKRRGKALVAAVAEDAPENKAEQNQTVSPEYLETVIGELEHESERRVKKLKRAMGDMRQEFLNHFQVELLKIPRKIREMKVDHFSSEFGGCMEEALKKAAQWEVEKVVPTSASRSKSIAAPAAPRGPGATPRGGGGGPRVAATPANARAPRCGETIMSVNGSPLAAVPMSTAKLAATIKVKGSKSKLAGETAAPSLLVELPSADGCVALNDDATLKSLQADPEMKADAISHLQSLQDEISKAMKSLQQAAS